VKIKGRGLKGQARTTGKTCSRREKTGLRKTPDGGGQKIKKGVKGNKRLKTVPEGRRINKELGNREQCRGGEYIHWVRGEIGYFPVFIPR